VRNLPVTDEVLERVERLFAARVEQAERRQASRKAARDYRADLAHAVMRNEDLAPQHRHQRDPILAIVQRSQLPDLRRGRVATAAHDIRAVYFNLGTIAMGSIGDPDRLATAGVQTSFKPGAYDWVPVHGVESLRRYRRWCAFCAGRYARGTATTWLELAIDVVIDNRGTRSVDRQHKWRHGTTQNIVIEALEAYWK